MNKEDVLRAAEWLNDADGLLITAGAGMGVDSGLPDFRGEEGFWKAHPALAKARINFQQAASPRSFQRNPQLAWGFYGHRLNLYRNTVPHEGFELLRLMAERLPAGAFVFTSNVDGQFQKAGFAEDRIVECHGSIHFMQCMTDCSGVVWAADGFRPEVDEARCRLINQIPPCPHCGDIARPNILMFDDWHWLEMRTVFQKLRLDAWLAQHERIVIIELGAGTDIPTVRRQGERLNKPLIRINPRESAVREHAAVGLACGALEGIRELATALGIACR